MAVTITNKTGANVHFRKRTSGSWDASSTTIADDASITVGSGVQAILFNKTASGDFSGSTGDGTTADYLYYDADGYHIAQSGTAAYDLEDSDASAGTWIGWGGSYSSPSAMSGFDTTAPQPAGSLTATSANVYALTVNFGEAVGSSARYPNAAALDSSSGLGGFTFSVVDHAGDAISGASAAVSSISHSGGGSSATATVTISGVSTYNGDEHLKMVYSQSAGSGKIYDASAAQIANAETIVAILPLLSHNNGDLGYSQIKLDTRQFEGNGTTGAVELAETVQIVTAVIPQGVAGSLNLGSTTKELGDVFLADNKSLKLGSDQDVDLKWASSSAILDLDVSGAIDADASKAVSIDASASNTSISGIAGTLSQINGSSVSSSVSSISGSTPVFTFTSASGLGDLKAGDVVTLTDSGSETISFTVGSSTSSAITASSSASLSDTFTVSGHSIAAVGRRGALSLQQGDASTAMLIGTGASGLPITIGHSTSEVTVADNLTVTGDLTVNGATTTISTTELTIEDHVIIMDDGAATPQDGAGIEISTGGTISISGLGSVTHFNVAGATAQSLDVSGITVGTLTQYQIDSNSAVTSSSFSLSSAFSSGTNVVFTFSSSANLTDLVAGDLVTLSDSGNSSSILIKVASSTASTITGARADLSTSGSTFAKSGHSAAVARRVLSGDSVLSGAVDIKFNGYSGSTITGVSVGDSISLGGGSGGTATLSGLITGITGKVLTVASISMSSGSEFRWASSSVTLTGNKAMIKWGTSAGQDSDGAFQLFKGSAQASLKLNDLQIEGNKIKAANLDAMAHGDLTAAMTDKVMVLNASSGLGKGLSLDELFQAMSDRHVSLGEKAPLGGEADQFVAYSGLDAQLSGTKLFTLPSGSSKFAGAMVQVFVNGVALRKVDGTAVSNMNAGGLNEKAYYVLSDSTIRFGASCFPDGAKCVISYFKQQDTVS